MEWIGLAKTSFHHSPNPLSITFKAEPDSPKTLLDLCESVTPPCQLNPFLWNGHLQTIWGIVAKDSVPVYYKRKTFEAQESRFAGTFAVDFVVEKNNEERDAALPRRVTLLGDDEDTYSYSEDNKPMLIVLHGLSGGSGETCIRQFISTLVQDGGWEACVLNMRGCAKSKITSRLLYHGGATWDLRQLVNMLKDKFPNRPLFALGFSFGANILTNYLAEEGASCYLKAVACCSSSWDLKGGSLYLQRSWLGSEVYSRALTATLTSYIKEHASVLAEHTQLDLEKIMKAKYLYEFDKAYTAPASGYPTSDAYYRDVSSSEALMAVQTPYLALSALDDPILPVECIPFESFQKNPYTVLCTTSLGGHLGWLEKAGTRWFPRQIMGFFNAMAKEVDLEQLEVQRRKMTVDSWLTVEGCPPGSRYDPTIRKLYKL